MVEPGSGPDQGSSPGASAVQAQPTASTPSRLLSPAKPRQAHMPPPLDPPSLADLSPSLVFCYLQALLEAQQLGAVMGQASAQARGGPKGGSSSLTEVEEGSAADHAAAAARDAVTEATPLTEADHKYLAQAEKAADKADKEKGKEKEKEDDDDDDDANNKKENGGSKLLLVQPSRVTMFVPGCGVRPFLFSTVCDGNAPQLEVYHKVAQDAVSNQQQPSQAAQQAKPSKQHAAMQAFHVAALLSPPYHPPPTTTFRSVPPSTE